MRTTILAIALGLVSTAALAQAPQPPQQQATPGEQALGQKLMEEINSNVSLRAALIKAQEQVKALEEKDKPKDAPNVPQKPGPLGDKK